MSIPGFNPNILNYDILKYQSAETRKIDSAGSSSVSNAEDMELINLEGLAGDNGFESKLKRAMEQKDEKALKEVCQDLENIFLQMMYKQMKSTIIKSELIPEGSGRDVLDSMLDEALMEEASKVNGIGLGDMMYKQMYKKMSNAYRKNTIEE